MPGPYEVLRKIAAGGMAEIFLARGPAHLPSPLVVKRMLPHLTEDEQFVKMFLDEAVIVSRLDHPNVVKLLDFGRDGGAYYLALEYVKGANLESLARAARRQGKAVPFALAARIVAEVCGALAYAHGARDEAGRSLHIVHRDISPSNILLSEEGLVKLADFGIAKARGNLARTQAGVLRGKYQYMAPEQAKEQPVDARTDLFALGSVLYKITAGWQPFERDTEVATLRAVAHEDPPPPTALVAGYPASLEEIVFKALAKEPAQRFQSALEMKTALEGFLVESGEPAGRGEVAKLVRALAELEPLTGSGTPPPPEEPPPRVTPVTKSDRRRDGSGSGPLEAPAGPRAGGRRRRGEEEPGFARRRAERASAEHRIDDARLLGLAGVEVPMLGRAAELSALCDLFKRAVAERRSQAVLVVGPVGVGKTRLVHELGAFLESLPTPPRLALGRASPGQGSGALAQALLGLAGALAREGLARRVAWGRFVAQALSEAGDVTTDRAAELAALAGELIGLDYEEDPDVRRLAGDPRQLRLAAVKALCEIVAKAAHKTPLVLVVDDLHAGDAALVELVEALCAPAPARLLVVALTRPELPASRPGLFSGASRLELGPLGEVASRALAQRLLGGGAPEALVREVAQRAGGNPLLAEEIARALEESREANVPADVEGAIAGRFNRLPEEDRRALSRASVLGDLFAADAAEAVGAEKRALKRLVGEGLLGAGADAAGNAEYRFVRASVREAAYAALSQAERASLHRAAAHHLAQKGDSLAMARHLERAGEPGKAAAGFLRAGDAARARYLMQDALAAYARGADIAPEPAARFELALKALAVCHAVGDRAAELDWLGRASALAQQTHDPGAAAELQLRRANYHLAIRDLDAAEREAALAIEGKRAQGDRKGEGDALAVLASIHVYKGRLDEAMRCHLACLGIARAIRDPQLEARGRIGRGSVKIFQGDLWGGQRALARAVSFCAAAGEVQRAALALAHLAETYSRLGDPETARRLGSRALGLFRRIGHRAGQGLALLNLSDYHRQLGQFPESEAAGLEAQKLHEQMGSRMEHAFDACYLARTYLARQHPGDLERALAMADMGVERAQAAGNATALVMGLSCSALARFRRGERDAALERCDRAVRTLREKRPLQEFEIEALLVAHYIYEDAGRAADAAPCLDEAHQLVREGAQRIPDGEARQAFLERVAVNAAVEHAWPRRKK